MKANSVKGEIRRSNTVVPGLRAAGCGFSGGEGRGAAAARQAFRRHFTAGESGADLAPDELGLLQCLLQAKAVPRELPANGTPNNGATAQ